MIKLTNLISERLSYKKLWTETLTGLEVKPIDQKDASQFVEKHYLGKFPSISNYYFGVFINGELIGCVIYGPPTSQHVAPHLSRDETGQSLVQQDEIYELQRLFINDVPGLKNIESSVLAKSNRLLHDLNKRVKVVITYADPGTGHVGAIYQATNAIYQGKGDDRERWMINRNEKDFVIRDKQLHSMLHAAKKSHLIGGSAEDILKSGLPVFRKKIEGKHRYIYILRDRKRIEANLKVKSQPYPKKEMPQEPQT
jgi:hypothetical protein